MPTPNLRRFIAVYEKATDAHRKDLPLTEEQFVAVRRQLGASDDEPMYDCYPLVDKALAFASGMLDFQVDPSCQYLLETAQE